MHSHGLFVRGPLWRARSQIVVQRQVQIYSFLVGCHACKRAQWRRSSSNTCWQQPWLYMNDAQRRASEASFFQCRQGHHPLCVENVFTNVVPAVWRKRFILSGWKSNKSFLLADGQSVSFTLCRASSTNFWAAISMTCDSMSLIRSSNLATLHLC